MNIKSFYTEFKNFIYATLTTVFFSFKNSESCIRSCTMNNKSNQEMLSFTTKI